MPRGPKKHLKRLNAPKHWMLDKLSGNFAPRPSPGPHKLRECLPLVVLLRNRLKYALNYSDVTKIMMQRLIKVDGKVRTDVCFPSGFMDVITIEKTGEFFRLLYDVKGRFVCHRIGADESTYKLGKVKRVGVGKNSVPYIVTHDARTIKRDAENAVKVNDTVVIDIKTGKVTDYIKFDTGNTVMVIGGRNTGRVGIITHRERHASSYDIVHIKDAAGNHFATRLTNIFLVGKGNKAMVTLPRAKGVRLTISEERDRRLASK